MRFVRPPRLQRKRATNVRYVATEPPPDVSLVQATPQTREKKTAMQPVMPEPRLTDLLADDTMRQLMERDGVTVDGLITLIVDMRRRLGKRDAGQPWAPGCDGSRSATAVRAGSRFWVSTRTSRAIGAATAEPPPPCSMMTEQAYRGA
jgi:hypothetical protein